MANLSRSYRASWLERNPLYPSWSGMRRVCGYIRGASAKDLKLYAGIDIHPSWCDYKTFERWCLAHGWAKGLKVTRKDKTKDFCPENCIIVPYDVAVNMRRNTTRFGGRSIREIIGRETTGRHDRTLFRVRDRIVKCGWDINSAVVPQTISRSNIQQISTRIRNEKRKEKEQ